jgi:DNA-binding NarL/FixJ family response regulator
VVEDFEPFRRSVASILQKRTELQIICEVADGMDAVQKAEELRPDLILLDIGLPKLNGIEAARRIRQLAPLSKILFVSQESSADVVDEAFATGASGYLIKTDAGRDLLTAVDAVLRGERFVSKRFANYSLARASNAGASEDLRSNGDFGPRQQKLQIVGRHEVGFYSDDQGLLDHVTQFIGAALKAGNAAVVIATHSHREVLLSRLQTYGLNIEEAIEQGRYVSLDAAAVFSTFMVNGMPDPVRFLRHFDGLITNAAKAAKGEHSRVTIFGEGVHLLWAQGNPEGAIQVEKLADQLAKTHTVDILCGYCLGDVQGGMDRQVYQRICAEHSVVYSR